MNRFFFGSPVYLSLFFSLLSSFVSFFMGANNYVHEGNKFVYRIRFHWPRSYVSVGKLGLVANVCSNFICIKKKKNNEAPNHNSSYRSSAKKLLQYIFYKQIFSNFNILTDEVCYPKPKLAFLRNLNIAGTNFLSFIILKLIRELQSFLHCICQAINESFFVHNRIYILIPMFLKCSLLFCVF